MRLKITLKGKRDLKIPFNYNHILSSIIYNKIDDLDLAYRLHSSNSFKFFTFSQLNINNRIIDKDYIIAKDGIISFYLSSPSDLLIKNFTYGFIDDDDVKFLNEKLKVSKIEVLRMPDFEEISHFKTISPIIIRSKKEIDGDIKTWDLAPSDQFFRGIENNLIKKYCVFNKIESTEKEIKTYSEMAYVKRKRISINKGSQTTYHRAYMMDLILEGDVELIKFAYDCGLGEKNSVGFGMVKLG